MEGTGPHLTTGIKGNWNGLYRRFLDSPNFVSWYTVRKEEANQKLRLLHLDQLCKAVSSGSRCDGEPLLLVAIMFILISCTKLQVSSTIVVVVVRMPLLLIVIVFPFIWYEKL